jgi:hypothetical protein
METTVKNSVKEISWPGKTYISSRNALPFDKLSAFFAEKYGAIYGALGRMGIQVCDPPCAIYYSVDEQKMVTDLAAAVPVPEHTADIAGFTTVVVPASKALTITHYGPFEGMTATYALLDKYIAEHALKKTWAIEEYLSDPAVEKDPANWKTNIYFGVE